MPRFASVLIASTLCCVAITTVLLLFLFSTCVGSSSAGVQHASKGLRGAASDDVVSGSHGSASGHHDASLHSSSDMRESKVTATTRSMHTAGAGALEKKDIELVVSGDLEKELSYEGYHWTGSSRYHNPTLLFKQSEIEKTKPWEVVPETYPNVFVEEERLPLQDEYPSGSQSVTATTTATEASASTSIAPPPQPRSQSQSQTQHQQQPPQQRSSTQPSLSSRDSPKSMSYENRMLSRIMGKYKEGYNYFRLYYTKNTFKLLQYKSPIYKAIQSCVMEITQLPKSIEDDPKWVPFNSKKFMQCIRKEGEKLASISYEMASMLSTHAKMVVRSIQVLESCFDISRYAPADTILTKGEVIYGDRIFPYDPLYTDGVHLVDENHESARKLYATFNDSSQVQMFQPYHFPAIVDDRVAPKFEYDWNIIHKFMWDYIPTSSDDIKKVIKGRCAVVSGSSVLLNYELGSEIDSYDTVIRFSNNPVEGYEKHVGTKTTLRPTSGQVAAQYWDQNITQYEHLIKDLEAHWLLFWENPILTRKMGIESPGLYEIAAKRMIELLEKYSRPSMKKKNINHDPFLFLLHQRTIGQIQLCLKAMHPSELNAGTLPTSGIRAIMGLIPYCDSIDLYGFSFRSGLYEHYFSSKPVSRMHDLPLERWFVYMLAMQGLVDIIV